MLFPVIIMVPKAMLKVMINMWMMGLPFHLKLIRILDIVIVVREFVLVVIASNSAIWISFTLVLGPWVHFL